jgi:uncharacterized protein
MNTALTISILPERLAVCRLSPDAALDHAALSGNLWSITRTADELSVVLPEENVQPGWLSEDGWRALKVLGPLDFSLVGILSQLSGALAAADVSLFALSTYDTDYILVKETDLTTSVRALESIGCRLTGG